MENTENIYYNAKPSKIGNIGKDISGARRMNYDTYETVEEREIKAKKKAADKRIADIKLAIKTEVLSESPDINKIKELLATNFELVYGFNPGASYSRNYVINLRPNYQTSNKEQRDTYNKLVSAYNSFYRINSALTYRPARQLAKMASKYKAKIQFVEKNGAFVEWKNFQTTTVLQEVLNHLKDNTNAVQFGNSVTDNERAYISEKLSEFLKLWQTVGIKIDTSKVNWSFGARGRVGSVAYYQSSGKIISVNRNNIGSLIHELGHYIDDISNDISYRISYETIRKYRESIENQVSSKDLDYYLKKCEIFARAFEAYCYKKAFGFSDFAQCGNFALPELNDELIGLIESALNS